MTKEEDDLKIHMKAAQKYCSLADSARQRGLEFNLSLLSLLNLYKAKRCFFTKKKLSLDQITIDRVDNRKGYVTGNVVACDASFNSRKGSLTPEDIKILYMKTKHLT